MIMASGCPIRPQHIAPSTAGPRAAWATVESEHRPGSAKTDRSATRASVVLVSPPGSAVLTDARARIRDLGARKWVDVPTYAMTPLGTDASGRYLLAIDQRSNVTLLLDRQRRSLIELGERVDGVPLDGKVFQLQYEDARARVFDPTTKAWQPTQWPLDFQWGHRGASLGQARVKIGPDEWRPLDATWIWPVVGTPSWVGLRQTDQPNRADLVVLGEDGQEVRKLVSDVDGVSFSPNGAVVIVRRPGNWGWLHEVIDTGSGRKVDEFKYNIIGGAQVLRYLSLSAEDVVESLALVQFLVDLGPRR
jgi:hypothetical protein